MSITPKGLSIQSLYKDYRDNKLMVNRKYQRKLVWTLEEKEKLINTILQGYPIPLFLFAERKNPHGNIYYEIIDGLQRLNAIFEFIENNFSYKNKYFDIEQLARTKQLAKEGMIQPINDSEKKLSGDQCADFLDYQLAVTIFPAISDNVTSEVFNRINSGGKQLSNQERRQAGVLTPFGDLVRKIASEIRGDVSPEILSLQDMPTISIESAKQKLNYGLAAEDTLWCKQGILWARGLRDSEDEEIIADILASILLERPFNRSREMLDELYSDTELSRTINSSLSSYGAEKLFNEVKEIFSIFNNIFESESKYFFRDTVMGANRNPAKASFYTVFMALFELIVKEGKSPDNFSGIVNALQGLQSKLTTTGHYIKADDRIKNINLTKGLISNFFVKKEPPILGQGPSLTIDLINSLRRSKIETPRYEFKQGILNLNDDKSQNNGMLEKIVNTICAIANLGRDSEGFIYIGIADSERDAYRIKEIYGIEPYKVSEKFIVGIDRECKKLKISIDEYVKKIVDFINNSKLSNHTKLKVLSQIDTILYKEYTVIRIRIPSQSEPTYVGDKIFIRKGNSTIEVTKPKDIVTIVSLFGN